MTAPPKARRFVDRKSHDCGCVTVWANDGPRYLSACKVHAGYAQHFLYTPLEGVNDGHS